MSLESSRLVTATFAFADAVAAEAEMTYYGQALTVIDPATTRASASPAMYMAVFPQAAPAGMVLRGVQGSEAYTGNAGLTRLITWLLTQGCDGGSPCAMVYAAVYAADGSHTDVTFSPVAPADRLYLPAVSRP